MTSTLCSGHTRTLCVYCASGARSWPGIYDLGVAISDDDPRPPYRQIADDLRQQIESGDLSPGERLRSARALAAHYGVAVQTAQNALTALRTAGLTDAVAGRGTFVRGPNRAQASHVRIADDLRREITTGELPAGEKLPSTRALMDRYGVGSQTVQNAITALQAEGLVESVRGRGTFVQQPDSDPSTGDLETRIRLLEERIHSDQAELADLRRSLEERDQHAE